MEFEQKGLTSFPVEGKPREFYFVITVNDEKLSIKLEDRLGKEQWATDALGLSDFVTLETAIPQARVVNYAARIAHILAPKDEDDQPTRSLSRPSADGSRVLCVGYTLRTTDFTTVLEYSFTLASVPLEPTDLLEARMRDLEVTVVAKDTEIEGLRLEIKALQQFATGGLRNEMKKLMLSEIEGLRNEIKQLKVSPPAKNELELERRIMAAVAVQNDRLQREVMVMAFDAKASAEFHAAGNTTPQQAIAWTPTGQVDAAHFSTRQGQQIVVSVGGLYTIFVSILHGSSSTNTPQIEVVLDGKCLRTMNDFHSNGHNHQSTMMIRTRIRANSYLQVFYRGNNFAYLGSTIALLQESK